MLKVTEAIVQFKVSERSKENAWKDLVLGLDGVTNHDTISDKLFNAEIEYMEAYHTLDPEAKTKNGRWKTSKYLPNAYKSAKSVIIRALKHGVSLTENGVARGKSAVEQDIQTTKKPVVVPIDAETKKILTKVANWRNDLAKHYPLDAIYFDDELKILLGVK